MGTAGSSIRASRIGSTGGGASTDIPRASHMGALAAAVRVQKNAASTQESQRNHLKAGRAPIGDSEPIEQLRGPTRGRPHEFPGSLQKSKSAGPTALPYLPAAKKAGPGHRTR